MTNKSINYAFTVFETEDSKVKPIDEIDCKYIIIGKEICPKTGKDHLQGYVHFKNAITLLSAKKRLGANTAHLEACKGSIQQNIEYCKKNGNYDERGM